MDSVILISFSMYNTFSADKRGIIKQHWTEQVAEHILATLSLLIPVPNLVISDWCQYCMGAFEISETEGVLCDLFFSKAYYESSQKA